MLATPPAPNRGVGRAVGMEAGDAEVRIVVLALDPPADQDLAVRLNQDVRGCIICHAEVEADDAADVAEGVAGRGARRRASRG